jgi:hypothetical protein
MRIKAAEKVLRGLGLAEFQGDNYSEGGNELFSPKSVTATHSFGRIDNGDGEF